jgi:hypothetical protein
MILQKSTGNLERDVPLKPRLALKFSEYSVLATVLRPLSVPNSSFQSTQSI